MKVSTCFHLDQEVRHIHLGITGFVQGLSIYRTNTPRVAIDYVTQQGDARTDWFDVDQLKPAGD